MKVVPSGVEPPSPGPKPRRIATTLRDYLMCCHFCSTTFYISLLSYIYIYRLFSNFLTKRHCSHQEQFRHDSSTDSNVLKICEISLNRSTEL